MPHIHEKIDFTAQAWIVCNDRVLIRKHDKYDLWLGVGGHIELDEDPDQAVIREVKEEVGLAITLIPPPGYLEPQLVTEEREYREIVPPMFLNSHRINDIHRHISFEFAALSDSDRVVPENPTDMWRWLTEEEIEQNALGLWPHIQRYSREALRWAKHFAGKS